MTGEEMSGGSAASLRDSASPGVVSLCKGAGTSGAGGGTVTDVSLCSTDISLYWTDVSLSKLEGGAFANGGGIVGSEAWGAVGGGTTGSG